MSPDPDYRRNLPHITSISAPLYITTRLTDSLPIPILKQLQLDHLDLIEKRMREPDFNPEVIRSMQKRYLVELDKALDACLCGPVWLSQPEIADIVASHVHKIEEEKLVTNWCFTIMPNHIHLLFSREQGELKDTMQLVKGRSAYDANRSLGRSGTFWQHESYDHFVRENEFGRIVRYILLNPVKAKLCKKWQEWPWTYLHPSIFGFEDI